MPETALQVVYQATVMANRLKVLYAATVPAWWVHFTVLRCICVFVFSCISLHACCIIVARWGGPGGIEA